MAHAIRAQGLDVAGALFGAPDAAFDRLPLAALIATATARPDIRRFTDEPMSAAVARDGGLRTEAARSPRTDTPWARDGSGPVKRA
ncbi:hypothetical protein [Neoroseomonas rubea]|uniref:hypothetical protein n=1 Tax=Neoroseomonas rubea TaxID=2748666 RepID=UPI0018E03664|nr:hypothetical protein [Roseomonas rubea]